MLPINGSSIVSSVNFVKCFLVISVEKMISVWESQPSAVLSCIVNKEDLNAPDGTGRTGDHWKVTMINTVEDLLFLAFRMFLTRAATDIGHAHWFIVDASEQDPHSLAHFMHISHELLMVLLKGCQLTLKNGSVNAISSTKIEGFIQTFRDPALEFTSTRTVIDSIDKSKKMYHLLRIGRYRKNENFTFSQQIAFKKEEKRRVPNFRESCHHKV